jgi:hypothetical protein
MFRRSKSRLRGRSARRSPTRRDSYLSIEALEDRRLLAISFLNISPNLSDTDNVDPDGASGGRVNGLATSPGSNQIFYAASEFGGIYKTLDQGLTWSYLSGHLPQVTWDVEVDPSNANCVYATSFYDGRIDPISGIQVSNDGGASWSHPLTSDPDPALEGGPNDNTPQATYNAANSRRTEPSAFGIGIRRDAANNVAIGTNSGVAITNDSGLTWRIVDPTPGNSADANVWDVVWQPAQAGNPMGIIDIVGDDGHRRSTDGGATWTAASNLPAAAAGRSSIVASPDESYVLYVTGADNNLYESVDAGATWTLIGAADPVRGGGRIPFVAINDTTAGFDVWTGGVSLFRVAGTTPAMPAIGGASRISPGGSMLMAAPAGWFGGFTRNGLGNATGAHDDVGDIVFDATMAIDAVPRITSNDGGVYWAQVTSAAPTGVANLVWEQPTISPHAHWIFGMDGFDRTGANAESIYYGTQDAGSFAQIDAGGPAPGVNNTWHNEDCCDVFDLAADNNGTPGNTADDRVLYSFGARGAGQRRFPLILADSGLANSADINTYPAGGLVPAFNFAESIDTWAPNSFAALTFDAQTGVDDDGDNTIDEADEFGAAGSDGGLFITTNISANPIVWTELIGNTGDEPWNSRQAAEVQIATAAGVPTFFVSVGGGNGVSADQLWFFNGTNPAGTWTRIDNNIPNANGVSIWAVDPVNPQRLYASALTNTGPQMWFSTNQGTNWMRDMELEVLMSGAGAFLLQNQRGPTNFTGFNGYPQPTLLAFDPEVPNVIAAGGADSGLFLTTDAGTSWRLLSDPLGSKDDPLTTLANGLPLDDFPHIARPRFAHFDHESGNVVDLYAGTQGSGVWRVAVNFDLPPDALEPNDTIATATVLGSLPKITINDVNIHNATDVDFFRYTAQDTGKVVLNVLFDLEGNLDLRVRDKFGNIIATAQESVAEPGVLRENLEIPVVSQQQYFIEVFSAAGHTNEYDLEIENFAAPVPTGVILDPASDTGMMNNDNVTSDTTPTFFVQTDVLQFVDANNNFLVDATEIHVLTAAEAQAGNVDGVAVEVTLVNTTTGVTTRGFAAPLDPTSPEVYTFTPVPPLAAGVYLVTARLRIFDNQADAAGAPTPAIGRTTASHPLLITIDATGIDPGQVSADLIDSSDTGMFNDDNVTNKMSPAFNGIAPVGAKVRLFANGDLVGQTVAGTDASDVGHAIGGIGGAPDDGLGLWEITSEPLADDDYNITLEVEDAAGNVTVVNPIFNPNTPLVDIVVDTLEPNTPLLDLLDDTGRHNNDNITRDNTPQVSMTTTDPNIALAQLLFTDNLKFRIFDRFQGGAAEVLIYDSAQDPAADAVATPGDMFTAFVQLTRTLPFLTPVTPAIVGGVLANGVHNLKLEVEDRAGNISHDFLLQITVDTTTPPVSFGLPDAASQIDGLAASSDSGVATIPASFADRVTSDSTPRLWGRAEADSIVRVFLDRNNNGAIDLLTDTFLGQTVAVPIDGNVAYPEGYWEIDSALDLNEIVGLPRDGVRRLLVTGEDVAGNPVALANLISDGVDDLRIFIDTQGARVTTVEVNARGNPYDLFNPKPITDGPTPPVNALVISVSDLPNRSNLDPNFLYGPLVAAIAANPGHYVLTGDHSGVIPIERVLFTADPVLNGFPATGFITLVFASPLPDDRYTLSLSESLVDPAGNLLDGESNSVQPLETPAFPSGDGLAGGDFHARFTVDSRPEIGTYAATSVYVDANGNFVFDPEGQDNDFTNRDLSFNFGATTDGLFAGNFSPAAGSVASGFAQLGSYGFVQGAYRFRIDLNHNGRLDPIDLSIVSAFQVNAAPVAGNFDNNAVNGDEIGLFDGTRWLLDSNHDHILDVVIPTVMRGFPIVGDFNGDGADDFGVYDINLNHFTFDLDRNGTADDLLLFGFPGISERPLAADFNLDGIDDLVLWVPDREGQPVDEIAEWYVLNSDRRNARPSLVFDGFAPIPLGNDQFAQLGDADAQPLVGNIDPPPFVAGITPPAVEGVFIRDNQWSSSILQQIDAQSVGHAGAAQLGYPVSAQTAQMQALPWAGLNTIAIAFSEDVQLNGGHLAITDENGNAAQAIGFVYDPALRTATWTLGAPLPSGKHTIRLSDSVVDSHGAALDGEWLNGSSSLTSGDGVAGGDFVFQFDVTPISGAWQNALNRCDVNGDGNITPLDALIIIHRLNNGGAGPLVSPAPQFMPSAFYDVNGDDKLTPLDALNVINLLNRRAEPQAFQAASGAPNAPVAVTIASTHASDSAPGAQANSDDQVGTSIPHHIASKLDEVSAELALVRSLDFSSRSSVVADDVPRLTLEQVHLDAAIDEYSGLPFGRKRKLLSAVAFDR